jgi:hypothetical protein
MRGLLRNNGTEAEIRQALDLSVEVVDICGLNLQGGVPKVEEVLLERLF